MFGIPIPPFIIKALISILIVLAALGFGYYKGQEQGKLALQVYAAKAERQLRTLVELNSKISEHTTAIYFDHWNTIVLTKYSNQNLAKTIVPHQHNLSKGWIYLHDSAALGILADKDLAADPADSGIKDNDALAVVSDNYSSCAAYVNQLTQLQQWIINTKKNVDDLNKKKN